MPIITFFAILFSTLIVVVVLFKFLKSDASKTDKGYRLKGAAAGFVVILGFVIVAYNQLANSIPMSEHEEAIAQLQQEKWTIFGKIVKEGDKDLEDIRGISAVYIPEKPLVSIDVTSERITISDVLFCISSDHPVYPRVDIGCEGYYSYPIEIKDDPNYFIINKQTQTIECRLPIRLEKK
jgi:hypothetical protein